MKNKYYFLGGNQASAVGAGGNMLGDAIGGDAGAAIGGLATGAASGAAFGPIGMAVGGGLGLISGIMKNNAQKKAEAQQKEQLEKAQRMQSLSNARSIIGDQSGVNLVAYGGEVGGKGYTEFNEGGSHEANPLGGIPISQKQDGTQNLVEEGETKNGEYVFSDRLKMTSPEEFLLSSKTKGKTFADASKEYHKQLEERPNDTIAKSTFKSMTGRLEEANDDAKLKQSLSSKFKNSEFAKGGSLTEGEYDLGEMDLDMQEINFLKSQGYNVEPINVNKNIIPE